MVAAGVLLTASLATESARACATCFGASDSDLAQGMNWGIVSLLVVVVGVLSGFATFFVYIARRSAASHSHQSAAGAPKQPDAPLNE